tara:strand:- start:69 stop:998 length:930 start_codon:yes stop_codon:yes gene_type:complete
MLNITTPSLANIKAIQKLFEKAEKQFADKKLAKTFKPWNIRNVTLDPKNSHQLGYSIREKGVKEPITIFRNGTDDWTAAGNHRLDIFIGDGYTLRNPLPYKVITLEQLKQNNLTEKDFLAWAVSTNPQLCEFTSKPNNKATLKNTIAELYTLDGTIQTSHAKAFLEHNGCSSAYANEIIEEARMINNFNTYQQRTGRKWKTWSSSDLNKEKAKYPGISIAMSVGNLTLKTLIERVVDNDIARQAGEKFQTEFNVVLHFGDIGGEKNLQFWKENKAMWYSRWNNVMERYNINIEIRVLHHDIEIVNIFQK